MTRETAAYWIKKLELQAHPEGGYYRENYRSAEFIQKKGLPSRYNSFRAFSTSIYFLLKSNEFSALHRLKSDEVWHFYKGSPLRLYFIFQNGKLGHIVLGPDPENNEYLQFTIPRGAWFAAKPIQPGSFSLLGCTVAPGFEFDDFEVANPTELLKLYPQHEKFINDFTHD